MNTKEKIALATQNNKLYCFKEGMFYKVYNQNAMWFTQHIKGYKINSKFVKTVNQQVFSIGFPQSLVLANLLVSQNKALLKIEETQGFIAYKINHSSNEQAYVSWCNEVQHNNSTTEIQKNTPSKTIVQELKNFDLVHKTPMQAFEFVARLKSIATAAGTPDGFVKVIFDAKYGEWLGCHMIGAGVTDMIAEAVLGRKLETTGHEVLKTIHPHPTMSEAVMEAVADAYDEVIHL